MPLVLVSEPELAAITVLAQTKDSVTLGLAESSGKAVLTYSPFRLDFFRGDDLLLSTNARGLLKYEHQRHKKGSVEAVETGEKRVYRPFVISAFLGEEELSNNDVEEVDMWEESYGGHQDSKPKGPTAVAVDFTFAGKFSLEFCKGFNLPILQEQTMCMAFLNMQTLFH